MIGVPATLGVGIDLHIHPQYLGDSYDADLNQTVPLMWDDFDTSELVAIVTKISSVFVTLCHQGFDFINIAEFAIDLEDV